MPHDDKFPMEHLYCDEAGLARAAELIDLGEVVAIPTESTYGLAADALNPRAVERLVELKGRADQQPISVLVADRTMVGRVAVSWSPAAELAMQQYWPGALTLILKAVDGLPCALVNAHGGIGIRVSSDPVVMRLLERVDRPLTATSANRSGTPAATCVAEISVWGLAAILDDGPRTGMPSTVADLTDTLRILRQGPILL